MNREEWLKSLRPGDKVANKYYDNWNNQFRYSVYEIKRITPKGQIRLTNDILLDCNGRYHKYSGWTDSAHYDIEPLTLEIINY